MKIQNALVSILVINYNNEKLLSRALNSCLIQTYKNIEILIYDDKSTDNSVMEIKKFSNYKNINFFSSNKKKTNIPSFDAMNGYLFLFKESKGSIICLLDSDDYFYSTKVEDVVQYFKKNEHKEFLQNLPLIINNKIILHKKNRNNLLSFWPYLAPESCVSFKKSFMNNFIECNKFFFTSYNLIWLAFRLGIFSYFVKKNFGNIDKHLTCYQSLGQSKKYLFMNRNWFFRRKQCFDYLEKIMPKSFYVKYNIDHIVTNIVCKVLKMQ